MFTRIQHIRSVVGDHNIFINGDAVADEEVLTKIAGQLLRRELDILTQEARERLLTAVDEFVMAPISLHSLPSTPEGECNEPTIPIVHIEAGQWHSLEVLEEGTVVFEAKDGRYELLSEEDIMK